jgi:hypothetical protein
MHRLSILTFSDSSPTCGSTDPHIMIGLVITLRRYVEGLPESGAGAGAA